MGRLARLLPVAGLLLAVGACTSATVRQLDTVKDHASRGDHEAIVATELVDCEPQEDACRQLHLLRGDACFLRARELAGAHDAGAAAEPVRTHYDCAIDELQVGLRDAPAEVGPGPVEPFAEHLLQALRARQEGAADFAEARPYTGRLAEQAAAYRRRYPQRPAGYYFAAVAGLTQVRMRMVQQGESARDCDALAELIRLVDEGRRHDGRYDEAFRSIKADLLGLRRSIGGCAS